MRTWTEVIVEGCLEDDVEVAIPSESRMLMVAIAFDQFRALQQLVHHFKSFTEVFEGGLFLLLYCQLMSLHARC